MTVDGLVPVEVAETVRLVVVGTPITQGSKTKTRYGLRDDNAAMLKPWREAIKTAALDVMHGRERIAVPVGVTVTFAFDRPLAHYGTGRNSSVVKPSAPPFPANRGSGKTGGGDLDKLVRALLDGLTEGGVLLDDSRVVSLHADKVWLDTYPPLSLPGAHVLVEPRRQETNP